MITKHLIFILITLTAVFRGNISFVEIIPSHAFWNITAFGAKCEKCDDKYDNIRKWGTQKT